MLKKQIMMLMLFISATLVSVPGYITAIDTTPVAHWTFDALDKQVERTNKMRRGIPAPDIYRIYSAIDAISGQKDQVHGAYHKIVPGVSGNALLFDGNTTFVRRPGDSAPAVSGDFSISVWVALGAYPTHWCPVVDQSRVTDRGYFLGIDAKGHVGLKIRAGGEWQEIVSEERLQLRQWMHIAGVYVPGQGFSLYLNGKRVAAGNVDGEFQPASGGDVLIGKHSIKRKPDGTIRPKATEDVYTFMDGLIDELMIFDSGLAAGEISDYVESTRPSSAPLLATRTLPAGPPGPARFGAMYTSLKYYDAWDALWRVGENADVVVRFDEFNGRFVFWRGTSYIPHWVTENGIWYDNEFTETWSDLGCHEPMSDKRCEHSQVRIIENHDARVVVHWRYALVDNWYHMVRVDSLTGWGEWTDEVFTIYPDGVAVREVTLHSSQPQSPHEWHEGILVMGPGQRPEDILHPGALTLANLQGESYTYSWEHGIPEEVDKQGFVYEPAEANIHLVNTKSQWKPFVIVTPESNLKWDVYNHELRRDVSMFPWWNHWPTAQKPSDGRYAMEADQASHSSLSHCNWDAHSQTDESLTKIMLNGLTQQSAAQLTTLAKSWSYPAELKTGSGNGLIVEGYDQTERAYVLRLDEPNNSTKVNLELVADGDSPVLNPAFVIRNWGIADVNVTVNGNTVQQGRDLRIGYRNTLEGNDLIV